MKNKAILFLSFSLFCFSLFSQESDAIADLKKKIAAHQHSDTVKVKLLNDLAWEYAYVDPVSSINYCREAIALSVRLNFKDGEAFAYNTMGDNYRSLSLYDSAFYYFDKAISIRRSQQKKDKIVAVMINMANVYTQQKQYAPAILKYKEAIRLAEDIDYKKALTVALTNLADAYRAVGSYDKGMEALTYALRTIKAVGDSAQQPYIYAALAQIQHETGNSAAALNSAQTALILLGSRPDYYLRASVLVNMAAYFDKLNLPDSAIAAYNSAIAFTKQIGDSIGMGVAYGNLADMYVEVNQPEMALSFAGKAIAIAKNIKDTAMHYNTSLVVARVYLKKNDFKRALTITQEVLPLAEKQNNKIFLKNFYLVMAEIYKGLNRHDKRAECLEKHFLYKDSLLSEENNKTAARLNIEFDIFGKEKEIELLNKTSELNAAEISKQKAQKAFITGIASLFALIVVVIVFFFFKIRKSNKIISRQKERVEAQNEIISRQKNLVEEKQKEIIDSINYAKRIQGAVLTGEEVWSRISKEHFILFKPKDIVSGDFYWAHNTANGRSVFALADCTGHGVPGGFMSMLGNSFLNEIVVEKKIFSAAVILNKLREKVIGALEQKGDSGQKDGMDISLCVWNKINNTLEFAGANNPLMLLRENKIEELKADKMPIGKFLEEDKTFSSQTIQLQAGDCIYMSTDGYPDQFGGQKGKKFKYRQMEEILLSIHHLPMAEQQTILDKKFEEWKGSLDQVDDVSVIGVKVLQQ